LLSRIYPFLWSLILVLTMPVWAQDDEEPAAAEAPANAAAAPAPVQSAPLATEAAVIAPPSLDSGAAPVKTSTDDKTETLAGGIPDTTADDVLRRREILRPEYGFEDVFVVKGGNDIIDFSDVPAKQVDMDVSKNGFITGGERIGEGKYRITAGQGTGTTEVLLYDQAIGSQGERRRGKLLKVFRVTVTTQDLMGLLQQTRALIGNVEGLEIRVVGTDLVLDGKVLVPKDMKRVLAVYNQLKGEKKPVINLTELSPLTLKLLGEKMEDEIAGGKDKPRDIRVRVRNGRFFLEGQVDKKVDREIAYKICQAFIQEQYELDNGGKVKIPQFSGLGECVSLVRLRGGAPIEPDPIISVRVDFVTLSRDYFKSFNFRWAPTFNLNGSSNYSSDTGKFVTNFVASLTDLFPKLDTAANHGYARILKSLNLLVRDGVDVSKGDGESPPEATLDETIDIPYFVPGNSTNPGGYQFQKVQTFVKMAIKSVPGTDKLNLDIVSKQSELASEVTSGGPPPIVVSNSIDTSIVIGNAESAALGGLISERRKVAIVRDPAQAAATGEGIGSFNLFDLGRSHSFKDEKSQFIIFVTPQRVRSAADGSQSLRRKFRLKK
jgi:pilus assembly protein CpaC